MKQIRCFIILFLFINLGSFCACASQADNSSVVSTQTEQIFIEESIIDKQSTIQDLSVENTPPPEKSNQEICEDLLQEYTNIQDEYEQLIKSEGRLIFDQMINITEEYYYDFGEYPEGIDQLIPKYLSTPPTILGVIDVQYNLSYDKTSYQYFFILHPLGDYCECKSLTCAEGNVVGYFCEFYYDDECCCSD